MGTDTPLGYFPLLGIWVASGEGGELRNWILEQPVKTKGVLLIAIDSEINAVIVYKKVEKVFWSKKKKKEKLIFS